MTPLFRGASILRLSSPFFFITWLSLLERQLCLFDVSIIFRLIRCLLDHHGRSYWRRERISPPHQGADKVLPILQVRLGRCGESGPRSRGYRPGPSSAPAIPPESSAGHFISADVLKLAAGVSPGLSETNEGLRGQLGPARLDAGEIVQTRKMAAGAPKDSGEHRGSSSICPDIPLCHDARRAVSDEWPINPSAPERH